MPSIGISIVLLNSVLNEADNNTLLLLLYTNIPHRQFNQKQFKLLHPFMLQKVAFSLCPVVYPWQVVLL